MKTQKGSAILTAMLTVVFVTTLVMASLWQQWRTVEIEAASRHQMQVSLILHGALDWARLILREDAKTGGSDNLSEPWAIPLEKAKVSTFMNQTNDTDSTLPNAFLSGKITDEQSKLNIVNLIQAEGIDPLAKSAFTKLFEMLRLPPHELEEMLNQLVKLQDINHYSESHPSVMPQYVDQLNWLGLSPATVLALKPFVTILPDATMVNVNTAPLEVLSASLPQLDMDKTHQLINYRNHHPFTTQTEVTDWLSNHNVHDTRRAFVITSFYFTVTGELDWDNHLNKQISLIERRGLNVRPLWTHAVVPTCSLLRDPKRTC